MLMVADTSGNRPEERRTPGTRAGSTDGLDRRRGRSPFTALRILPPEDEQADKADGFRLFVTIVS
jgi:hypothetical protein